MQSQSLVAQACSCGCVVPRQLAMMLQFGIHVLAQLKGCLLGSREPHVSICEPQPETAVELEVEPAAAVVLD